MLGGWNLCLPGVLEYWCEASYRAKHTRRTVSGISGYLKLVYPSFLTLAGITSWFYFLSLSFCLAGPLHVCVCVCVCVCVFACVHMYVVLVIVKSLSCVQLFCNPCILACQAPLSMGFLKQEYWTGLPLAYPGDLSDQDLFDPGDQNCVSCICRHHWSTPEKPVHVRTMP